MKRYGLFFVGLIDNFVLTMADMKSLAKDTAIYGLSSTVGNVGTSKWLMLPT